MSQQKKNSKKLGEEKIAAGQGKRGRKRERDVSGRSTHTGSKRSRN
jgi:hypothetical protein